MAARRPGIVFTGRKIMTVRACFYFTVPILSTKIWFDQRTILPAYKLPVWENIKLRISLYTHDFMQFQPSKPTIIEIPRM